MSNEQEMATQENAADLELDLEDEGQPEPQPKKEYSTEQKLARVERMREKYLKELGLDKPEPKKEVKEKAEPADDTLAKRVEKMALKQAEITHPDDVELARNTAKKWGMDLEDVLVDEDFKSKLERQQTSRANIQATSGVKGGTGGATQAKQTAEYWIAKGVPPQASDVPDRKTRASIARAMLASTKNNKKFYNE
jgi:hypothetical protein